MNQDVTKKIRVLIVDDSIVMRELISHILSEDPQIDVIGTAQNGLEAVKAVKIKKPDVVTMDYHMPVMDGLDATRKIMDEQPTPIIIISGTAVQDEAVMAFHIIDVGAVAIVEKPVSINHPAYKKLARELVQIVKSMSEVKVIRHWLKPSTVPSWHLIAPAKSDIARNPIKVVAIGASTGGPIVIKTILSHLTKGFPAPILIVQHIAHGFTQGFVDWLAKASGFPVHLANSGMLPLPGNAYVAPDGHHMQLGANGCIELIASDPVNGHQPSVATLFRSVAMTSGKNAVGVLLTGMGKDGALELKLMKDSGAVTFVQNKETSIVFGMPGEAMKLDAASFCLSPEEIAGKLCSMIKNGAKS